MNTSDAIRSFLSRTIPRVYSFVAFPSKNAGTHIAIQKISLQAACIRQKTNPNLQMGSSRSSHGGQEFAQDYGEAEKGPFNWRRTSVHHSFSQQMPDAGVPASLSLLHNQNPCAFGSSATLPAFGITDILASQMSSNPFPSSHQFRRSRSGNEIPNQSQRHYFFGGTAQTSVLESSPSLPYSSYLMEATELNLGGPIALKRPRSGNGAGGCSSQLPTCQADGCWIDLSCAKHYYRRHRVCEYHSKATGVSIAGRIQRFCQQCSRFHLLEEFDEGKRSCRKRLEEHNRRRRKNNHHHLGSSDSPLVDSFPVDDQCNSACLNLYPSHSKQHQKVGEESSSWGFSGMEKQQSLGIEVNEYAENSALSQKMKHMEEEDDGAIQFSSYPFVPLSPF